MLSNRDLPASPTSHTEQTEACIWFHDPTVRSHLGQVLSEYDNIQKKLEKASSLFKKAQEAAVQEIAKHPVVPDHAIIIVARAIRATKNALDAAASQFEKINNLLPILGLSETSQAPFISEAKDSVEKMQEQYEALNEISEGILKREKNTHHTVGRRMSRSLVHTLGLHRSENGDGTMTGGMLVGLMVFIGVSLGLGLGLAVPPASAAVVILVTVLVIAPLMGAVSGFTMWRALEALSNHFFERFIDLRYLEKQNIAFKQIKRDHSTTGNVLKALSLLDGKKDSNLPDYQQSQTMEEIKRQQQPTAQANVSAVIPPSNQGDASQPPAYDYDANRKFFGYKS